MAPLFFVPSRGGCQPQAGPLEELRGGGVRGRPGHIDTRSEGKVDLPLSLPGRALPRTAGEAFLPPSPPPGSTGFRTETAGMTA